MTAPCNSQVLRALARSRAPGVRRRFLQLAVADFLGREIALEHDASLGTAQAPALLAPAEAEAATSNPGTYPDPSPCLSRRSASSAAAGPWGQCTPSPSPDRVCAAPSRGTPSQPGWPAADASPAQKLLRSVSSPAEASSPAWRGVPVRQVSARGSMAGVPVGSAGRRSVQSTPRSGRSPGLDPGSEPGQGLRSGGARRPPLAPGAAATLRLAADRGGTDRSGTIDMSETVSDEESSSLSASSSPDLGSESDSDNGLPPSRQCMRRVGSLGLGSGLRPLVPAIVCPPPGSSTCSSSAYASPTAASAGAGEPAVDASALQPAPGKASPSSAPKAADAVRPTIAVAASSATGLGRNPTINSALIIPAGFCFSGDLDEDVAALEALEGDLSAPPSPRSTPRDPEPYNNSGSNPNTGDLADGGGRCGAAVGAAVPLRLGVLGARAGSEPWGRLAPGTEGGSRAASTPLRGGASQDSVPRLALPGLLYGTPPPRESSPWAQARPRAPHLEVMGAAQRCSVEHMLAAVARICWVTPSHVVTSSFSRKLHNPCHMTARKKRLQRRKKEMGLIALEQAIKLHI